MGLPLVFLIPTFTHRPCNDTNRRFHPFATDRNPPCPATTPTTRAEVTTNPATIRRNSSKVATEAHLRMANLNRILTPSNKPVTAGIRNNTKATGLRPHLPTASRITSSKAHTAHRSTGVSSMGMTSHNSRVVSMAASSRNTEVSNHMANNPHHPPATPTTPTATPVTP